MKKVVLSGIFGLVFAGCLGRDLPVVNHYELQLQKSEKTCKKMRSFYFLGVSVQEKIKGKKIAYKESENRLEYFVRNEWIENLPLMVDALLTKGAQNHCVNLSQNPIKAKETLSLNIYDLYYDANENVAVFNALLTREKTIQKSIWIKEKVAVKDGDFSKIIEAMNEAVNLGIESFYKEITK